MSYVSPWTLMCLVLLWGCEVEEDETSPVTDGGRGSVAQHQIKFGRNPGVAFSDDLALFITNHGTEIVTVDNDGPRGGSDIPCSVCFVSGGVIRNGGIPLNLTREDDIKRMRDFDVSVVVIHSMDWCGFPNRLGDFFIAGCTETMLRPIVLLRNTLENDDPDLPNNRTDDSGANIFVHEFGHMQGELHFDQLGGDCAPVDGLVNVMCAVGSIGSQLLDPVQCPSFREANFPNADDGIRTDGVDACL